MSTRILVGDCRDRLKELPDESVHCVVTSPPYWGLRDYGLVTYEGGREDCSHQFDLHKSRKMSDDKQSTSLGSRSRTKGSCIHCGAVKVSLGIGLEPTFDEHLANLVDVFREVYRVLRKDGTVFLNYGDAYCSIGHKKSHSGYGTTGLAGGKAQEHSPTRRENNASTLGLKHKDLMMMPARVAMALQADGWWLRSEIIWHKPNPMPESATDRPTSAHEKIFLLSKSGDKLFWMHRSFPGVRDKPEPDYVYRLWEKVNGRRVLKKEIPAEPDGWRDDENWQRVNLWVGHDYFYDAEAVRVPAIRAGCIAGGDPNRMKDSGAGAHITNTARMRSTPVSSRANLRNVWTIATHSFKEAHFATFPPKLVEPCIKAGTSEHGVCAECGAPWVRVVDKELVLGSSRPSGVLNGADSNDQGSNRARDGHVGGGSHYDVTTTGWVPTCECDAATVPARVLDPFGGAGTVGLVAQRLKRDATLIEISTEYASMSARRIKDDCPPLLADQHPVKVV